MNTFIDIVNIEATQDSIKSQTITTGPYCEKREHLVRKTTSTKKGNNKSFRTKGWKVGENKRYAEFLAKNKDLFNLSQEEKKKMKLNVMMSETVQTRTATQCHSHHQNMLSQYGSIDSIIQHFLKAPKSKSSPSNFSLKVQQEFYQNSIQQFFPLKQFQVREDLQQENSNFNSTLELPEIMLIPDFQFNESCNELKLYPFDIQDSPDHLSWLINY